MILTWANQITILRILLILPFVICMLKVNEPEYGKFMRYMALWIFLVMCVSDVLDGYMARVKKQVTRLGTFLDPLADKLLTTCACVLLAVPTTAIDGFLLPSAVVVLIIGKDLLLLLGFIVVYLETSSVLVVPVFAGKICTFLQLMMVAAFLVAPEFTTFMPFWAWIVRILWISAGGMAILATLIYIRNGIVYIEQKANAESVGE
jgi:cardiolipin synthase